MRLQHSSVSALSSFSFFGPSASTLQTTDDKMVTDIRSIKTTSWFGFLFCWWFMHQSHECVMNLTPFVITMTIIISKSRQKPSQLCIVRPVVEANLSVYLRKQTNPCANWIYPPLNDAVLFSAESIRAIGEECVQEERHESSDLLWSARHKWFFQKHSWIDISSHPRRYLFWNIRDSESSRQSQPIDPHSKSIPFMKSLLCPPNKPHSVYVHISWSCGAYQIFTRSVTSYF